MSSQTETRPASNSLKSILITGASSGIGAALATRMAGPGIHLNLTARNRARLDAVAATCRAAGAEVSITVADVRDADAMKRVVEEAHRIAPLDLVIANAGITGGTSPDRPFESANGIKAVLDVNLGGVLNTLSPAIQVMAERRSGHVAIISSIAGVRGLPYSPTYSATKAALNTYSTALRPTLRRHGIAISLVISGFVETPLEASISSPRPLRISADAAAKRIIKGLNRRRFRIVFPLSLFFGARLLSALPGRWGDAFFNRLTVDVPEPREGGGDH